MSHVHFKQAFDSNVRFKRKLVALGGGGDRACLVTGKSIGLAAQGIILQWRLDKVKESGKSCA